MKTFNISLKCHFFLSKIKKKERKKKVLLVLDMVTLNSAEAWSSRLSLLVSFFLVFFCCRYETVNTSRLCWLLFSDKILASV